jgi:hypothetical protein
MFNQEVDYKGRCHYSESSETRDVSEHSSSGQEGQFRDRRL